MAIMSLLRLFGPALYVLLLTANVGAQELTAFELEDAVKSGFASCMRSQLNNPQNAGASHALVEEYCRCAAHRLAARMTRAEVTNFERNNKLADASMIAKVQKIGQECLAEVVR
jgi:hypothetical protein